MFQHCALSSYALTRAPLTKWAGEPGPDPALRAAVGLRPCQGAGLRPARPAYTNIHINHNRLLSILLPLYLRIFVYLHIFVSIRPCQGAGPRLRSPPQGPRV